LKAREVEGDPANGLLLTYTHPLTGGPTLPTFACELQLLTPKLQTKSHRHMSTTVYQVFKGEGATVVDGQRLEWAQGHLRHPALDLAQPREQARRGHNSLFDERLAGAEGTQWIAIRCSDYHGPPKCLLWLPKSQKPEEPLEM